MKHLQQMHQILAHSWFYFPWFYNAAHGVLILQLPESFAFNQVTMLKDVIILTWLVYCCYFILKCGRRSGCIMRQLCSKWSSRHWTSATEFLLTATSKSHTWKASVWACGWRWRPVAPSRWTESAAPGWTRWSEWSSRYLLPFQLHSSCSSTITQTHTISGIVTQVSLQHDLSSLQI